MERLSAAGISTVLLLCALAAPAVACAQAMHDAGQGIHARELLGSIVVGAGGDELGTIFGLLLDTRRLGQHYALLSVSDASSGEKRFVYPVNALWREDGMLRLNVPQRRLQLSQGYGEDWPSAGARSGARYVRAREVIGQPVRDDLGRRVGTAVELVIDLGTARTHSVLVQFVGGSVLPVPAHAVWLSPGGGITLQGDSHRRS